jgi:transcriptional regulator with XRE-family HTH domain
MPKPKTLGARIRTARKTAGLTARELSIAVNVGENTVYRWERGATKPTLAVLARIAATIGTTAGKLIDG